MTSIFCISIVKQLEKLLTVNKNHEVDNIMFIHFFFIKLITKHT